MTVVSKVKGEAKSDLRGGLVFSSLTLRRLSLLRSSGGGASEGIKPCPVAVKATEHGGKARVT